MPARNEARRLPKTLSDLRQLRAVWPKLKVLVIDDGSLDGTTHIARRMEAETLSFKEHIGVGTAVRHGILMADSDLVLLCDSDGAVPFDEILPLFEAICAGYDIAVGSRILKPQFVEVSQPSYRQMMGRTWKKMVRTLLKTSVSDTQCSFKLFKRDVAQRIFRQTQCKSFTFHAESMLIAQELGYKIADLPVRWRDQSGSKIKIWGDSTHMAHELLLTFCRYKTQNLVLR
jgi:dolichyl-phosphate beta-glucosyltransferase